MIEDEDALELIARLCARAMSDPKTPRGTKGGIGLAEIAGALGYCGDPLGADMALAIGTVDHRSRDRIEGHLEAYVMAQAAQARLRADWGKVYVAVADAYEDVMAFQNNTAGRTGGGLRYYRWARGEFYGRALNAAIMAKRRLFRLAA